MRKKVYIFIASFLFSAILWGSISLSDVYYTTIDVKLKIVNIPQGYTIGSKIPDKVSLKIRGEGWKLVSSKIGADAEFKISADSDSGQKFISLFKNLSANQWVVSELEVIDIVPDTISLNIERIVTRKLPVEPFVTLEFKPGFGLADKIKLIPDSVTVWGPISYINSLEAVETERSKITGLNKKTEKIINLPNITGVNYNTNSIRLILDVQKIVDKEFQGIYVSVLDVPSDKEVLLIPNRISCSVRGGIEVLGSLSVEQFTAYVNYNDVVQDTIGSIVPAVNIPDNVTLQFLKPERLRYIIKSF